MTPLRLETTNTTLKCHLQLTRGLPLEPMNTYEFKLKCGIHTAAVRAHLNEAQ